MPHGHISKDILNRIHLTRRALPPARLFIDQPPQLAQQVGTEERASSADRDHRIGPVDISPFERQRAQPPVCVQIRHAVPTPVVAHSKDFEGSALQRMEGVRDGENLCATVATVCIARFSPRPKWKRAFC